MNTFYSHLFLLFFLFLILRASSAANTTAERCHPHDKRVLLRINRETYNNSIASWDPNTDCCNGNWSFVKCDDSTNRINAFYDGSTPTPFPASIGDLPYLTYVAINNKSSGPIPASLSKLRRLKSLYLSRNSFTGPIPSFFGTFQNLNYLYLGENLLSGPIPPSLGFAPISFLYLSNNRLTGPIPDSFGSFKQPLIHLYLDNNMLSGELPRSLDRPMFSRFSASGNMLEGNPSFIFGNPWFTLIDLSSNNFSFNITNMLEGNPSNDLSTLYLDNNKIYGSLPKDLALTDLADFNVSSNQLCGRIPTGGNLKNFDKTSYLNNKCLCGTPLPHCASEIIKYGLILGLGIPGFVSIIGLIFYLGGWMRNHNHHNNTEFLGSIFPHAALVRVGLDGKTIESYPKTVVGESGRLPNPADALCAICLSDYQPMETLRSIPECNHYFHVECVDEWLSFKASCPICRTHLLARV